MKIITNKEVTKAILISNETLVQECLEVEDYCPRGLYTVSSYEGKSTISFDEFISQLDIEQIKGLHNYCNQKEKLTVEENDKLLARLKELDEWEFDEYLWGLEVLQG